MTRLNNLSYVGSLTHPVFAVGGKFSTDASKDSKFWADSASDSSNGCNGGVEAGENGSTRESMASGVAQRGDAVGAKVANCCISSLVMSTNTGEGGGLIGGSDGDHGADATSCREGPRVILDELPEGIELDKKALSKM